MTQASDLTALAPDYPKLMMQADIESGKATVRSLGLMYAFAMAHRHARGGLMDFTDINGMIANYRAPGKDAAARAMSLEPVKKIAWAMYEDMVRLVKIDRMTRTPTAQSKEENDNG